MSDQWLVVDQDRGNKRPVDSRSEAESVKSDLEELGATVEILAPGEGENQSVSGDGVQVVDHSEDTEATETRPEPSAIKREQSPSEENERTDVAAQLPDDGPSVDTDPLVWMPEEFTDTIDGTVAINRKGFEVLAHHYEIQCRTDLVTNPVDADTQVIVKAEATDMEGDVYTAYGSASKSRGDDTGLLVEMADTRAYKRAVSRATGVGMVAVSELENEL